MGQRTQARSTQASQLEPYNLTLNTNSVSSCILEGMGSDIEASGAGVATDTEVDMDALCLGLGSRFFGDVSEISTSIWAWRR